MNLGAAASDLCPLSGKVHYWSLFFSELAIINPQRHLCVQFSTTLIGKLRCSLPNDSVRDSSIKKMARTRGHLSMQDLVWIDVLVIDVTFVICNLNLGWLRAI